MTASEHLKCVAGRNTVGSAAACLFTLPFAFAMPLLAAQIIVAVNALGAMWVMGLWTAWFSVWAAEHTSAIESIYLTEGTAQMQRRIIEQRNEIEKLKRK